MVNYIIKRLLALIPVLVGVTFLTFSASKITPGDPIELMLGEDITQETYDRLREGFGLNDPFFVQYGRYVWNLARGDFGTSYHSQLPVREDIFARFPSTFQLTIVGLAFAVFSGILIGTIAATAKSRIMDGLSMVGTMIGLSIPNFWLAIILIIIFAIKLRWFSAVGGDGFKDLILPAFCLGLHPAAVIARLTRSCLLEVIQEDYVRTARAKGLRERIITIRHVMPNALIPVVTLIGLMFGGMLGGTVFIESVFARPGIGRFAVNAIQLRDYPQVMGVVIFAATIFVMVNLFVDLVYGILDPRIRYD